VSAIGPDARAAYWDAVSTGDTAGAVGLATGLVDAGADAAEVLVDLVCAAQVEVGQRWLRNEWNVAREHAATSVSEDVIAALAAQATTAAERGIVVVSCVEGEWHALPARVLATLLRLAGWEVRYLGASVPAPHLAQFLHDVGPDVVALSCSVATSLPRARRMIETSRQAGVPVLAGGRGFGPQGRWALALGANAWAASGPAALERLDAPGWPRYTDPAPPLPGSDAGYRLLSRDRAQRVARSMRMLADRFPPLAAYDDWQRARTEEDFGHILDFLAAALYVDDTGLFAEFASWLADVLEPRGVPVAALELSLDVVRAVTGDVPGVGAPLDAGLASLAARATSAAS
jgi:methanogenic corrinoid protein MtbC1